MGYAGGVKARNVRLLVIDSEGWEHGGLYDLIDSPDAIEETLRNLVASLPEGRTATRFQASGESGPSDPEGIGRVVFLHPGPESPLELVASEIWMKLPKQD